MLMITFRAFRKLGARLLNRITDYLTRHSHKDGTSYVDPGMNYEHWASAIKFRDLLSVQDAVDDLIDKGVGWDTFIGSILLGEMGGNLSYPMDINQADVALGNAIASLTNNPGARIVLRNGTYTFQRATSLSTPLEIMGESIDGTVLQGALSGQFDVSGEVSISGGGYFSIDDGLFSNMTFTGENGILTVNDSAAFEHCRFECYNTPAIILRRDTTTSFKNCEFVWMPNSDAVDGMIVADVLSTVVTPQIYTVFSDCVFRTRYPRAVSFIRYEGFDNIGPIIESNWITIGKCSKIRFIRCAFEQLSTNAAIPLIWICRDPSRDVSLAGSPILRMIVEIVWCKFHTNAARAMITDATMVDLHHNSFWKAGASTNDSMIYIRSGYKLTAGTGAIFNPTDSPQSDAVTVFGNIFNASNPLIFTGDAAGGLGRPSPYGWSYFLLGPQGQNNIFTFTLSNPELSGEYHFEVD